MKKDKLEVWADDYGHAINLIIPKGLFILGGVIEKRVHVKLSKTDSLTLIREIQDALR